MTMTAGGMRDAYSRKRTFDDNDGLAGGLSLWMRKRSHSDADIDYRTIELAMELERDVRRCIDQQAMRHELNRRESLRVAMANPIPAAADTSAIKPTVVNTARSRSPVDEDIILILDPDCAFIEKAEHHVEEGFPIAAQGYYTFKEKAGHEMDILKHYCRGICTHFDPVAVPVMIHKNDLERLAPLWLKYTEDIRKDRSGPNKWPIQWNDNKYVVNRIEWVAEMFGYVLAAAHLGLRHEIVTLQMVPSVQRQITPHVPILHFHVPIEASDKSRWGKTDREAWKKSTWPVPKGTDPVTARMLTALHDAREAVGQTERTRLLKWGDYQRIWLNPMNETEPASTLTGLRKP